eukprot:7865963-Alexandrium_andersonii.AAC.1
MTLSAQTGKRAMRACCIVLTSMHTESHTHNAMRVWVCVCVAVAHTRGGRAQFAGMPVAVRTVLVHVLAVGGGSLA